MVYELTSEHYFNEVKDYVRSRRCYLVGCGKKVYGNCPFCQKLRLDSHNLYFGIWCFRGKVYLGCHNPSCNFRTSNNILDFVQRIEGVDFHGALTIWQEFLGIEPVSKERYLSDLNDLHEACRDAFTGNGKYKQMCVFKWMWTNPV